MLLQKLVQFMSLSGWVTTINGGEGGVREGGVGEGEPRHFSLVSLGEKASAGKEKSR